MLRDVEWSEDRSYRSRSENEPIEFYLESLSNSSRLDLLLGYFSSAAINLLSVGFAKFLSTGGTVRMIINDVLSEKDKEVVRTGLEKNITIAPIDLSDIHKLKEVLNEYGAHFFECLAWLISSKKIDLKIIKPKYDRGIAHFKSGIFHDGNNQVCFKGSCNFTANALLGNLEEITTFLSWEDGRSQKEINSQNTFFEKIFSGNSQDVQYLDANAIKVAIVTEFGNKDIDDLLINEKDLLEKKDNLLQNKRLKKVINKVEENISEYIRQPRFPYPEGPRPYQQEAYEKWVAKGYKGIFAMATGTGKTITSLNCLLNEYEKENSYKAIILVPTVALVEQWKKECYKFRFNNVVAASSKEKWNDTLAFFNTANNFINASYIVIVTYASFTKARFQSHFKQLSKETLLIADEAHNLGSSSILKLLPKIHLGKRIGLSATPNRQFDESGNTAIEAFFNDRYPYAYSYTMKQAMENMPPALCRYMYHPHVVRLDEIEMEEYASISKRLLKYINAEANGYRDCPEVQALLLARKRIIHKAKNKKTAFRKIMEAEFRRRGDLKYTLVYVPEGSDEEEIENHFYSSADEYVENEEDVSLIDEYTRLISDLDYSVMVRQYTSKTKERDAILKDFENGHVHVLTSMKCLDEGVDVPRSELAIFCASTGNPRQFIQRRGRVLRLHEDKIYAVIHDLVVVPKINEEENNYDMERGLVKKELERVVDFSELSMNKLDTYEVLEEVLDHYNLNLVDFIKE